MNFGGKILELLKQFGDLHFAIKWNVCVVLYAICSFLFGSATLFNALTIILIANVYALPAYVTEAKGIGIPSNLLLAVTVGVCLLGYFISFYLTSLIWLVAMILLFRREIFMLASNFRR